jgi:hypothetical protein
VNDLISIIIIALYIILAVYIMIKRNNFLIFTLSIVLMINSILIYVIKMNIVTNILNQESVFVTITVLEYIKPIIMLIINIYLIFISYKRTKEIKKI